MGRPVVKVELLYFRRAVCTVHTSRCSVLVHVWSHPDS